MTPTMTFAPYQSSPLAREKSPFKDPRPPPCIPDRTARLWDEHEKRAVENAKRRETACATTPRHSRRSSRFSNETVMDIIGSYDPSSSPKVSTMTASPKFDFGFSSRHQKHTSTTVAICKTCKQPITSTLGICERCKKTIVLPSVPREPTPPLSPAARNFGSTDLPQLQNTVSGPPPPPQTATPKRTSPSSAPPSHAIELPIRLSSLRPPPTLHDSPRPSTETVRPRKESLTDPNEPFLRLQISRKPIPPPAPTTPPSTSHSHHSLPRTRPSSLANVSTPPSKLHPSARHDSASPSELSTLYPYLSSSTATPPPSLSRASYQLQNTTSAWDDWDSDEEEKVGLVGYWKGRKWRGSRGSMGGQGGAAAGSRRDSAGKDDGAGAKAESGRKRRGFVRVISCGCSER